MPIDRKGPIPPSKQLANILREQIVTGEIPTGQRIPSFVELEQEYEIARDTIRKAVRILKDEGLVETVQGMGIFVIDRAESAPGGPGETESA
jgi:GntR family transcriptional regulator